MKKRSATRTLKSTGLILWACTAPWVFQAAAQAPEYKADDCTHNRQRGECSPGTDAPTRAGLRNTIVSGSATKLMGTLEYGERVECSECVKPLVERIMNDDNAQVREFGAWWLRRRTMHLGYVMATMKDTLANDDNAVRRSRAAAAIGELLSPQGLAALQQAATNDASADVRKAAVSALARLNHAGGHAQIASAMADDDAAVRLAAVQAVKDVNFFENFEALIGALADDDARVRRNAAKMLGQLSVDDAVTALAGLLRSDGVASVRAASAWALGRIGGAAASAALSEVEATETDKDVLNAIAIAKKM